MHSASTSYDLREGNYFVERPELEMRAVTGVYELFFETTQVPSDYRKGNKWRELTTTLKPAFANILIVASLKLPLGIPNFNF